MHATPQMITSALQLYFTGESFTNVQKFLKLQGVKMSHVAIYKWIKKYVTLMKSYLEKITPNVSDALRADELYMKVKGNPKYLLVLNDKDSPSINILYSNLFKKLKERGLYSEFVIYPLTEAFFTN